jgi:hypothetical protein
MDGAVAPAPSIARPYAPAGAGRLLCSFTVSAKRNRSLLVVTPHRGLAREARFRAYVDSPESNRGSGNNL